MSTLDAILKEIDKKYGQFTVRKATEFPNLVRVPTGIFSLDANIGGGIPKGRICIFAGNESTGKTTIAKLTVAQFQNTCKNCLSNIDKCTCGDTKPHKAVMVDIEGAFDPHWFASLGGNLEDLLLLQPEFAEQGVDIVEALIRTGDIDLIVVDSIAMMSPADELEKSAEDLLVGTHARLMNRMMRSIQSGMNSLGMTNEKKPAVILINQVRQKIGVMYGTPDTYPGGRGQAFASSITVKFTVRASELIYEGKKDESPVGITIRFKVEKNKTFVPLRTGMFVLYVADSAYGAKGSINIEEQMVDYAIRYGIIEKSGAWYSLKVDKLSFSESYQGKSAVVSAVLGNNELRNELYQLVMDKVLEDAQVTLVTEDAE